MYINSYTVPRYPFSRYLCARVKILYKWETIYTCSMNPSSPHLVGRSFAGGSRSGLFGSNPQTHKYQIFVWWKRIMSSTSTPSFRYGEINRSHCFNYGPWKHRSGTRFFLFSVCFLFISCFYLNGSPIFRLSIVSLSQELVYTACIVPLRTATRKIFNRNKEQSSKGKK